MMAFYISIVLLLIFIAASAFFAASEVAFLSLSSVRLHSLVEKGVPGAEALARLRTKRRRVVISLLIGGNVANVAASAVTTSVSIGIFGDAGIGIAVGVMSFILLTLGDIAPKSVATTYGQRIALLFAPLIEAFYLISFPFVLVFEAINYLIPGVYSTATGIEQFTEEDVRSAVKLGAKHKGISKEEHKLIENVLEFNDRRVSLAMTPKTSVFFLPAEMPVVEAHKKALESPYSRFPVINRQNKVLGMTNVKLLGQAACERPEWAVEKISLKPVLLRTNDTLQYGFGLLQHLGRNIAIVVDEKGKFAGVVTLEDLLEELVGEIK